MSTPHYHPRATEFLYMISGSNLKVGFIQENGARFVSNVLNPGQGAIFPKGSFHYQANLDCGPATFVAGLNSEDPGVGSVAQICKSDPVQVHLSVNQSSPIVFGLPPDVTDAALGDVGVDEVVSIAQSVSNSSLSKPISNFSHTCCPNIDSRYFRFRSPELPRQVQDPAWYPAGDTTAASS